MTNNDLFLITGAAGAHGATGNHAARQLLASGLRVRAFVRRNDGRAEELRALGAEIVVGDLHNFEVVRAALDGVARAYFTYPLAEGLVEATAVFAVAGKDAGLQSMVNMSQITAQPNHPSPAARRHWLAEQLLDRSGIAVTHLRPPYFLENLITMAGRTIADEGKIYLPYGRGRHAPISGEDLARVAVAILTDPEPHRARTYVPTGPVSLSIAEMATVIGRVLDRPVEYVDIPVEKWQQILSSLDGFPAYLIEHLSRVAEAHQQGEFDALTDVVETIGGEVPTSLEEFVRENATAFGGEEFTLPVER
jgi:NAD(P)H dehydrogenase (quinone)